MDIQALIKRIEEIENAIAQAAHKIQVLMGHKAEAQYQLNEAHKSDAIDKMKADLPLNAE